MNVPSETPSLEQELLQITEIFAQGRVEEALQRMGALEHRVTEDKARAQIMARYATFFHLLDMLNEELSALAQALVLDPNNPRANYLNALHLMSDERWDDAVTALNTSARYYPPEDKMHLAEVYGNLSYCWEQIGDLDRAQMYEDIAADYDPEGLLKDSPEQTPRIPIQLDDEDDEDDDLIIIDPLTGERMVEEEDAPESTSSEIEAMLHDMGVKPGQALTPAQLRQLKRASQTPERPEKGGAKGGASRSASGGAAPTGAPKAGTRGSANPGAKRDPKSSPSEGPKSGPQSGPKHDRKGAPKNDHKSGPKGGPKGGPKSGPKGDGK